MPILPTPRYKPALFFLGAHAETLYPYLFRNLPPVSLVRERIELPDGDFLDLDWFGQHHSRLLILCHGLEGSSDSQYMRGMTTYAYQQGFAVLCINFRSCSGEINRNLRMYHHGEISDLQFVIDKVINQDIYQKIYLCGFSLGGNVILKYMGIHGPKVPDVVKGAVAVSVPCDLASSSLALDQWYNYMYTRRFRKSLRKKFEHKSVQFPGLIDMEQYDEVKTWEEFDNTFTTKVTGFKNAGEYYQQGSANNFIAGNSRPTLIINALNDPFLQEKSYPIDLCKDLPHVYLEMPKYGGHVGFWFPWFEQSYIEKRSIDFLQHMA